MLMLTQDHRKMLERAIPAYMMLLMLDRCKAEGFEARADLRHHLNVASVAPLSQANGKGVAFLAREVERVSQLLTKDLGADTALEGLYVCAAFALLLVDEGRLQDKGNQAVLCGMLILDDAKDETPDVNGERPVWAIKSRQLEDAAGKMILRANLLGFYGGPS